MKIGDWIQTFTGPKEKRKPGLQRGQIDEKLFYQDTDVFEEGQQRKRPDNGADTTNNVFFWRHWSRWWPNAIERVKGRCSNVRVDDTLNRVMVRQKVKEEVFKTNPMLETTGGPRLCLQQSRTCAFVRVSPWKVSKVRWADSNRVIYSSRGGNNAGPTQANTALETNYTRHHRNMIVAGAYIAIGQGYK